MPHRILVIDGAAKRGVDGGRLASAKEGGEYDFRQFRLAGSGEVHPIKRQWLTVAGGVGKKLPRGREEVDERHAFPVASDFGHRGSVEREVDIVVRWNLE